MAQRISSVAIVGRTNVGKSTLFNALVGKRIAVVEDTPGVTRDRNYAFVERWGFPFTLVDTGGLVGEDENPLRDAVRKQAEIAIDQADLVLAVVDAIDGLQPGDEEVADLLRRGKPGRVIWVVNKCEKPGVQVAAHEFHALGVDELVFVSAAHKIGIAELAEKVREKLGLEKEIAIGREQEREIEKEQDSEQEEQVTESQEIKVAILGRPNVGKSTLVNKILGEERLVTSDIAGTTRDSIDLHLTRDGQRYHIVDTAGLRRKPRIEDGSIERYSVIRALKVLVDCDVAVLVIDATQGAPGDQEAKIAELVTERGRGLVLVVNKWDAIEKDHHTVKDFERAIRAQLPFAAFAPIVFVSALSGRRCPQVLETVKEVYTQAQSRIATSQVNKLLSVAFERKPPPLYRGEPIRFFFATQIGVAPPEFVLFVNHPRRVNNSYQRYLKNILREEGGFTGSEIKLRLRKRGRSEEKAMQKIAANL